MTDTFDTLAASENLQECELNETQAKGIARAINSAIVGNVATKKDLESLESSLKLWMFKALGTVAAVIVVITKLLDFALVKIPR